MKDEKYKMVLIFHVETGTLPEIFFLEGYEFISEVKYVTAGNKAHIEIVLNDSYSDNKLIVFKIIE